MSDRDLGECPVDGCERPIHAAGLCSPHYSRRRKHGDVMAHLPVKSPGLPIAERLLARSVRTPDGCLQWQGPVKNSGYANFRIGRRAFLVHRVAYAEWVGPIPEGLQIDHLCRNRVCIEPTHLEAVTASENLRRIPSRTKKRRAECPHCGKSLGADNMWKHLRTFHESAPSLTGADS